MTPSPNLTQNPLPVTDRIIKLHPVHFDHNALYHVIEMGALVLVFRGALEPGDADPGSGPVGGRA